MFEINTKPLLPFKTLTMDSEDKKIRPGFIAHRGESFDAPENTLASVNLAWQRGIREVEVDVHLSADNEICVIHDRDTLRTTGENLIVKKSSLKELQKLDAGSWKGEEWAGEKIPSLKEVLATVPSNGKLVVEIKSDSAILQHLSADIRNSGLRNEQLEIIAFNLQTLAKAKQMMPQHKMLWLYVSRPEWLQYLLGLNPASVIRKLRKYNIDGVNIGDSKYFEQKYIERFTAEGFSVYTWTVNDPDRAFELQRSGVDCITTDRAAWMTEVLKDRI